MKVLQQLLELAMLVAFIGGAVIGLAFEGAGRDAEEACGGFCVVVLAAGGLWLCWSKSEP